MRAFSVALSASLNDRRPRVVSAAAPHTKVVLLCGYGQDAIGRQAVGAGALGYVLKGARCVHEILELIEKHYR